MKSLLFYCTGCQKYTLEPICADCQEPTHTPAPPRYSPEDKYGDYRRRLKKETT